MKFDYICKMKINNIPCRYQKCDGGCSANMRCSYQIERIDSEETRRGYVRKERWYEKYYRDRGVRAGH